MSIDFDKTYPWAGIETVTIDGQQMVKIPKFYAKTFEAPSTSKHAGQFCRVVSDIKRDGFHVHPAFMSKGKEIGQFYIGAYEASASGSKACSLSGKSPWVNITNPAAISACAARNTGAAGSEQYGWHLQTVYERAAIAMLMLIELGTPNVQTAIASGNVSSSAAQATGATAAKWRGIHEFWGNVWEHTDGIQTNASSIIQIFDNQGNGTYKNTGVVLPGGWIKETSRTSGDGFDLGDVFVPSVCDGTESNGTYSDYSWVAANCVLYQSGGWAYGSNAGAFAFDAGRGASDSYSNLGFRVAKV